MQKRGRAPYLFVALVWGLLLAGSAPSGWADTDLREAASASKPEDLQEIGKQLNNPVSSIWNITTQSDLTFLKGELSPAYRGQFTFNFQPVLPIPLTSKWNLIPRPVIPILSGPFISGVNLSSPFISGGRAGFRGVEAEWSRTGGLGDIALVTMLSPNIPHAIIGFGPTFIFPTATSYYLGQGKLQIGPAAVLGFLTKKWVGLIFAQNWWSVAGTPRKTAVNQMNLQYVLVRMLPGAWQIQTTPNILINWNADKLGNAVTFPLGLGVGRTFRVNPGMPPISLALEFQWMPVYPEDFGQRFNIRFTFKPVLPNLVKKPIFGS